MIFAILLIWSCEKDFIASKAVENGCMFMDHNVSFYDQNTRSMKKPRKNPEDPTQ